MKLSEDVGSHRSLLVCCKGFNAEPDAFDNLTIKKIPDAVMGDLEWARDDYSFNIGSPEGGAVGGMTGSQTPQANEAALLSVETRA